MGLHPTGDDEVAPCPQHQMPPDPMATSITDATGRVQRGLGPSPAPLSWVMLSK